MAYVVQRRDSDNALWHTCSLLGKKCRYEYFADARISFRKLKNMPENTRVESRVFRILDTETNEEVE